MGDLQFFKLENPCAMYASSRAAVVVARDEGEARRIMRAQVQINAAGVDAENEQPDIWLDSQQTECRPIDNIGAGVVLLDFREP